MQWARESASRFRWWFVWTIAVPFQEWLRVTRLRARFLWDRRGLDERYLWDAFSFLAQLDLDDWAHTADRKASLFAGGAYVEVRADGRRFAYQQVGRVLTIFEWGAAHLAAPPAPIAGPISEGDLVAKDEGATFETRWHEIYRTGLRCEPEARAAVAALRVFYGEGPKEKT